MSEQKDMILENFLSSAIRTLDTDEIYNILMDSLILLLHPQGLLLTQNLNTGRSFCTVRRWGEVFFEKDYSVPSDAFLEEILHQKGLLLAGPDLSIDDSLLTPRQSRWLAQQNIHAIKAIRYQQAVIGLLYIADSSDRIYTEDELTCLDRICYYAAYLLRNANLYHNAYHSSITDSLTSLYNRKHAFECIKDACSTDTPISLILLDIDDFKLYNELYGATEGDNLITLCAQAILSKISPSDLAFRYGTDVFMILTQGDDPTSAGALANEIIHNIISLRSKNDTVWDTSITCGISTFPSISPDAKTLLHNAEQAIYYGKLGGKGHLTVYRTGLETRSTDSNLRTAYERVAPTIYALTAAIDAKDSYTFIHSMNVSKYAVILARDLGMSENDIELVRDAGMLHDIGKISIPERILQKTSQLTPEEYEIMKTHTVLGYRMMEQERIDKRIKNAALMHHERFDGKGYPFGLTGDRIDTFASIVAIADVYDAMTAARCYRGPLCPFCVIEMFETEGFQKYDVSILLPFLENVVNSCLQNRCLLNDGRKVTIIYINKEKLSRPVVQYGEEYINLADQPDLKIEKLL